MRKYVELTQAMSHSLLGFLLLTFCFSSLKAQDSTAFSHNRFAKKRNQKRLCKVIITESALYTTQLVFLQFIWYKDHII